RLLRPMRQVDTFRRRELLEFGHLLPVESVAAVGVAIGDVDRDLPPQPAVGESVLESVERASLENRALVASVALELFGAQELDRLHDRSPAKGAGARPAPVDQSTIADGVAPLGANRAPRRM